MGTWQDVRYGARGLLKSPGFAAAAVLVLALGIGANSAIFSVVNAVLLRSLPYQNPERLVWVGGNIRGGNPRASVSPPDFLDYRAQNNSFEEFAASTSIPVPLNLTGAGEPERLTGSVVTTNYFRAFGVKPLVGRTFNPEDERTVSSAPAVVLSHGLWQRRFGADPAVVGKSVLIDGKSATIIGVAPQSFQYPAGTEIWAPLSFDNPEMKVRRAHFLRPVGLLKPDVTLAQAQAEMDVIAGRLEQQYPDSNTKWSLNLVPLQEQVVGNVRASLWVLLGAVGFVLLIACANVANLMLARATARHKEIAIRTALGASRARVVRQLLTESLLLSLLGGALGVLLAVWSVDALVALAQGIVPRAAEIGVDSRVLGFTLAVSVLTGAIFGLLPALRASKPDLNEVLKEGGRSSVGVRHGRVRSSLVVAEVALALMLLVGSGLLIRSFVGLQRVNPGFEAENVLTLRLSLARAKYPKAEQAAAFFDQLQQRVAALPGVVAVGTVSELPLSGQPNDNYFTIAEHPPQDARQQVTADFRRANHDYFRAMSIPVLRGRPFTEQEARADAKVVVINETLATTFFPGEDPLGKHLVIDTGAPTQFEIVGVVGDVRHRSLEQGVYQMMYVPSLQVGNNNLVIRTASNPAGLAAAVRQQVAAIDRDQPVSAIRTMTDVLSESVGQQRFRTMLLAAFAAVALVLAAVGIYGVISYSVTQRTHEIGVRMALGAQRRDVVRLIVRGGLALTLLGVALGLAGSFALTRVMSGLLFGVSATDPATFAGITALLTSVALLACYLPARRATKVDPMVALRYE
ncbi:MAG TPA: ABC transporter permease [Pyrinomonadaceae bacterium]|nr:ABC transporter permease [Pyrinomonadaceae bacterium]